MTIFKNPHQIFARSLVALVLAISGCGDGGDFNITATPAWSLPAATPPVGSANLSDVRGQQELAPGATLYTFAVGLAAPDDGFEVNVGFVRNVADAKPLIDALAQSGYFTKFVKSADDGQTGHSVRLDKRYAIQTDADGAVSAIKALTNLPASTEILAVGAGRAYTAEDGTASKGPFRINLLALRPTFNGLVKSALGTEIVPGRETTTSLSQRSGALAAINGGYFVTGKPSRPLKYLEAKSAGFQAQSII